MVAHFEGSAEPNKNSSLWSMFMPPWETCLQKLQEHISADAFDSTIRPLQAQPFQGGIKLYAPNRYIRDEVKREYLPLIVELLAEFGGDGLVQALEIEVGQPSEPKPKGPKPSIQGGNGKSRARGGLDPAYTFENFVEGESNRFAKDAAQRVADNPGSNNPLLFHGSVGLGKTHLMQAIGNLIQSRDADVRIVYCHCQVFLESMVEAVRLGGSAMQQFARRYQSADALLVDDIQFIAGAPQTQKEFLKIFNRLWDDGRQIVVTCDRYPRYVKGLEGSLKSRLSGGLHVQIKPPGKAMRVAILKSKALSRGVSLSEEVAGYIATVANANVRELDGALQSVIGQARFIGDEITLELAQDALRHLVGGPGRTINIGEILRTVADHYDVKPAEILSRRRYRHLVRSRHVAMYLVKELTNRSYSDIGKEFGGSHHTTVKSACAKIERLVQTDPGLDEEIHSLVADLKR
ncbi:MAG: chromosomal replication initiator protein DnaA [Gammaproteobacteria bacterium]|nr:chromosomal replication initiator protein DnaA [Gammaproteobacteria bacterium]MYE53147.1 chromosomal replication initiator protein DnaA [Gammaproteobacteria bacterium]MYF49853.1 chromosomal replication initiator protein DnaA [Gammaproteobacteria bacterium]MYH13665.1 chromosomal replication initiator protein DnaA [Gammaproteobacteria bacterium]